MLTHTMHIYLLTQENTHNLKGPGTKNHNERRPSLAPSTGSTSDWEGISNIYVNVKIQLYTWGSLWAAPNRMTRQYMQKNILGGSVGSSMVASASNLPATLPLLVPRLQFSSHLRHRFRVVTYTIWYLLLETGRLHRLRALGDTTPASAMYFQGAGGLVAVRRCYLLSNSILIISLIQLLRRRMDKALRKGQVFARSRRDPCIRYVHPHN